MDYFLKVDYSKYSTPKVSWNTLGSYCQTRTGPMCRSSHAECVTIRFAMHFEKEKMDYSKYSTPKVSWNTLGTAKLGQVLCVDLHMQSVLLFALLCSRSAVFLGVRVRASCGKGELYLFPSSAKT